MKKFILLMVSVAFLFAACSKDTETQDQQAQTSEQTTDTAAPQAGETSDALQLTVNADDAMKFDVTELKAKEGQKVKLTLHHVGKMPKAAMGHNWILLASGVDVKTFAEAAIGAKDSDYIPAAHAKDIIAHTKLIGGGETTEIEFTAPAKGTYDFICSFPGHYGMMHGKFIVE